ncbi:MAG: hypothetical protein KDD00_11105 [Ignavibacteriae bacterium]|nr:hypothetical protein [Ignavibacteriota bacterium]
MKKSYLKNIITVCLLLAFSLSGISGISTFCISDNCCKTVCCDENSATDNSAPVESVKKSGCCEFTQTFQIENQAVTPFTLNVYKFISKDIIQYSSAKFLNDRISVPEISHSSIQQDQSKTILRI